MSNLTDFFPSGGGGLTPKFEEFNASGTFTPTQALIDAGGYIEVFLVAGGSGGFQDSSSYGGQGGEAQIKKMYLTNTNAIGVTIGAGGARATWNNFSPGGNSVFSGGAAGGVTFTSVGGKNWGGDFATYVSTMLSPGFGGTGNNTNNSGSPGPGVNGYGMGGATQFGLGAYTSAQKPNSGQGGVSGGSPTRSTEGASGYCLIKWYE